MRVLFLLLIINFQISFATSSTSQSSVEVSENEKNYKISPKIEGGFGNTSNIALTNKEIEGSYFKINPNIEAEYNLSDNLLSHFNLNSSMKRFNGSYERSLGDEFNVELLSGISWYINENLESNTEVYALRNENNLIYNQTGNLLGENQTYNEYGLFQSVSTFYGNSGIELGPIFKSRVYNTIQEDDNNNRFKNSYTEFGGMAKLSYSFSKMFETKLKIQMSDRNYKERMANYTNGAVVEQGAQNPTLQLFNQSYNLTIKYKLLGMDLETSGVYLLEKDKIYAAQDSSGFSGSQSILFKIIESLKTKLLYSHSITNYKNLVAYNNSNSPSGKRNDFTNYFSSELNYTLFRNTDLGLKYSFFKSSSNEFKQNFKDHTYSTNISVLF